ARIGSGTPPPTGRFPAGGRGAGYRQRARHGSRAHHRHLRARAALRL
ncbi:MAG: hypothetical protein AVDCRST_MAG15-182, partial [uncultured Rubellimicrobium sp.]